MDTIDLSDNALVDLVRENDPRAYAELWSRHHRAAAAAARAFTSLDADDLVSEAFTRVLAAVRSGGGPTRGFRSYLLTAIRNVARDWGTLDQRSESFDPTDEIAGAYLRVDEGGPFGSSSGATFEVFRSLPERWREALWYSEVEQLRPRELAPLLGLSPNAASALVGRARRGFRDAWLSSHVTAARSAECMGILRLLEARRASGAEVRRIRSHTAECDGCAIAWSDVSGGSARLAMVPALALLGLAGAVAHPVWSRRPTEGRAETGGSRIRADRGRGGRGRPTVTSALGGAAAAVVTVTVIGAVLASASSSVAPVVADPSVPRAASPGPSRSGAPVPGIPSAGAAGLPGDTGDATASLDPGPRVPPRGEIEAPRATDPMSFPLLLPPAVSPPREPGAETSLPSSLPPLTVHADTSAGPEVYPLLSGTDARPGARIDVHDEHGTWVATTEADAQGAWNVSSLSVSDCGTDEDDDLGAGSYRLIVRQTVAGLRSDPSVPIEVTIEPPPSFLSPRPGVVVASEGFELRLRGKENADVQRIKVPDAAPCRADLMRLDIDGLLSATYRVPEEGAFAIGIRYVDPATGRHGPARFLELWAENSGPSPSPGL